MEETGSITGGRSKDKCETYSVEGPDADFRHYLARLRRCSRCFSLKKEALQYAVKLIVYAYNQHQLFKRQYPNTTHLSWISQHHDLGHSPKGVSWKLYGLSIFGVKIAFLGKFDHISGGHR